ncbi:MAG TPA: hypothetical protein VH234_02280 [Candidatus Saccharimonadales bacterium]|jgi:hypothetical protein|nr:hypothetical protein [Candidatus Saccharimonadales bacterium]
MIHAPITQENFDPINPDLAAPNAYSWVPDYLKAGSVVHIRNYPLADETPSGYAGSGVAILRESPSEVAFGAALERAEQKYGVGQVIGSFALDEETGEIRNGDDWTGREAGIYVTRTAFEAATATEQ